MHGAMTIFAQCHGRVHLRTGKPLLEPLVAMAGSRNQVMLGRSTLGHPSTKITRLRIIHEKSSVRTGRMGQRVEFQRSVGDVSWTTDGLRGFGVIRSEFGSKDFGGSDLGAREPAEKKITVFFVLDLLP